MNSGTVLAGNDGLTSMTKGAADDARDRRDVADEIEMKVVIERRIDSVRCSNHKERVAIGGRALRPLQLARLLPAPGLFSIDEWLA